MYAIRSYYANSSENDYQADSAGFGLSQEMFGDLTTLSLGYSRGWDTVGKRGDAAFAENIDRRNYVITSYSIHYTKLYD